jgi:two-component sensor histidine kinase
VPEGRIEIAWDVKPDAPVRTLSLEWIERGGPPVTPPTRRGFGSTLLQRVLTAQAQAQIAMDFEREGLRFKMIAPLVENRPAPHHDVADGPLPGSRSHKIPTA